MKQFLTLIIHKLKEFFRLFFVGKIKYTSLAVFGILIIVGILVVIIPARAADGVVSGTLEYFWDGVVGAVTWLVLAVSRICISLAVFFLEFFVELAGYNGYIESDTVILGWTMVRDLANMFFVVILLVIAIGTILGLEQYEWKKTLGKFIMAAIFINFSKMLCGLMIDVAHVFTITFVNAIASAAGGNLISMFKLDAIYKMVGADVDKDSITIEIFIAAATALFFAALAATTIGAYLVVMIARVVVLWVLIILSPLAFIFQVLPATKSYATQWWDKFSKQVLVAPVMVFFLWLAFATLGTGNANEHISQYAAAGTQLSNLPKSAIYNNSDPTKNSAELNGIAINKVSISEVSTWENMASFFVAIGFLMVGINVVQGMGVVGGGLVQKAQDFAGSVAKIATGYALGRKMVGAGVGLAKKGGIGLAKDVGLAMGGQALINTGRRLNQLRSTTPFLRKIPILGNYGRLRRQKVKGDLDKTIEGNEKNILATMRRDENLTLADKAGKALYQGTSKLFGERNAIGFGLYASGQKKYNMEDEEESILKRKTDSATRRKAERAAEKEGIIKVMVEPEMNKIEDERQQALDAFIVAEKGNSLDKLSEENIEKAYDEADTDYQDQFAKWQGLEGNAGKTEAEFEADTKTTREDLRNSHKAAAMQVMKDERGELEKKFNEQDSLKGDESFIKRQRKVYEKVAEGIGSGKSDIYKMEDEIDPVTGQKTGNKVKKIVSANNLYRQGLAAQMRGVDVRNDMLLAQAKQKGTVSDNDRRLKETAYGRQLVDNINIAEQLDAAAQSISDAIKNNEVKLGWKDAKEKLQGIRIDFAKNPAQLKEEMKKAAADNVYVRAVMADEEKEAAANLAKAEKEGVAKSWDQAESAPWDDYYKYQDLQAKKAKGEAFTPKEQAFLDDYVDSKFADPAQATAFKTLYAQDEAAKTGTGPALSDDDRTNLNAYLAQLTSSPEETARMRRARGEVTSGAVSKYFDTTKRNSRRYKDATSAMDVYDRQVEEASTTKNALKKAETNLTNAKRDEDLFGRETEINNELAEGNKKVFGSGTKTLVSKMNDLYIDKDKTGPQLLTEAQALLPGVTLSGLSDKEIREELKKKISDALLVHYSRSNNNLEDTVLNDKLNRHGSWSKEWLAKELVERKGKEMEQSGLVGTADFKTDKISDYYRRVVAEIDDKDVKIEKLDELYTSKKGHKTLRDEAAKLGLVMPSTVGNDPQKMKAEIDIYKKQLEKDRDDEQKKPEYILADKLYREYSTAQTTHKEASAEKEKAEADLKRSKEQADRLVELRARGISDVTSAKAEVTRAQGVATTAKTNYDANKATEDEEIAKIEEKRRIAMEDDPYGASVYYEKKAGVIEEETKEAKGALGERFDLSGMGAEFIHRLNLAKVGTDAAAAFSDRIKQADLASIFKKGAEDAQKILDKATLKGVKFKEPDWLRELKVADKSARFTYLNELKNWYTSEAEIQKEVSVDRASDGVMLEKKGVTEQASAVKKGVQKGMEKFNGVEKEQGAKMAADSIKHLLYIKEKEGKLDMAQETDMMASITFLTKNGWADDGLASLVNTLKKDFKDIQTGSLSGEHLEEAMHFKKVFMTDLGWGKEEGGKLEITNRSGGDRQNGLSRLLALGGNSKLMNMESAILHFNKANGIGDFNTGHAKLAKQMDSFLQGKGATRKADGTFDIDAMSLNDSDWAKLGEDMGLLSGEMKRKYNMNEGMVASELKDYAKKLNENLKGKAGDSLADQAERSIDEMKTYRGNSEYLTGIKQMGLDTTHVDDVGHIQFDQANNFAHGVLHDDAEEHVLGDWRKVDPGKRMSGLKIHAVAHMDEDTGTASHFSMSSFRDTFAGVNNELDLKRQDVRNRRLMSKLSADEAGTMKSGKLQIGMNGGALSDNTYGKEKKGSERNDMVCQDIARDWAVALLTNPQALMYNLASNSGVSYEDAMSGKLAISLPQLSALGGGTRDIKNVDDLIGWVGGVLGDNTSYTNFSNKYFENAPREELLKVKNSGAEIKNKLRACKKRDSVSDE